MSFPVIRSCSSPGKLPIRVNGPNFEGLILKNFQNLAYKWLYKLSPSQSSSWVELNEPDRLWEPSFRHMPCYHSNCVFDKSNDQMPVIFSGMILKIRSNRSILPSRNITMANTVQQSWRRNILNHMEQNMNKIIQSINRIILAIMIHRILAFRSRL